MRIRTDLAVALGLLVAHSTVLAQTEYRTESTRDYLEKMEAHFQETLPDFKPETVKGTGFKPFQRIKWFVEPRLGDQDDLIPGARWRAWESLQEMTGTQDRVDLPTWFNMGPTNVAGRVLAIEVHPTDSNIVYTGTASGGLWRSTDQGLSWSPLTDKLPTLAISAIEFDHDDPDHMWIGTGEGWGGDMVHGIGVLQSFDGGFSWQTTGMSYDLSQGLDLFELEYNEVTGTLLCAGEHGLFRSTDHGATWTEVIEAGNWKDVLAKPGTTDTYFAYGHGFAEAGVYRSTDDGLTWTRLENGLPTAGYANGELATTPANTEYVYFSVMIGSTKYIYRSTDGGDNWAQRSTQDGTQGWYNLTLLAHPQDPETVFSAGVNNFRSTNGGQSWQTWNGGMHVDHHATAVDPSNPDNLWFGNDGGCWVSTNGGANFSRRTTGLVTLQLYAMNHSLVDLNYAIGGTQDNGTYRYVGNSQFLYALGGDGFECEVGSQNPDVVWAEIYYGEHYRSLNGGSGMTRLMNGITEGGPWQTPTHMDYGDDNTLWAGHNTTVFKTTSGGGSWFAAPTGTSIGGGRAIAQSWGERDYLAVCGGTRIFTSDDHGSNFVQVANPPVANTISDIAIHPTNPDIMVLTTASYNSSFGRVYKTTDRGASWFDITNNLPGEPCNTIIYDNDHPDWLYVGTDLGVYVSFDGGDVWSALNVGLPNVVCTDLRWHPSDYLRVATYGRGMWELDISSLNPASIGDEPTVEAIQPLTLRVNGSPAGPGTQTTVRFGLRTAGDVDLGVYDVNGRRVQTLAQGPREARVDFVDVDTASLRSGVYFVRLASGGQEVSAKLIVE